MNKKIIAIAVLLLAVVVVFAACKKEPEYNVDYTVTLENGDVVEVYEDEAGENFVTNVDGDEIPVTTDEEGFFDNIEDLITETTTKKSDKTDDDKSTSSSSKPEENKGEDKEEPSSSEEKEEPSSSEEKDEPSSSEESSSESSGVEIGDNVNQGGSIDWDDIVAVP